MQSETFSDVFSLKGKVAFVTGSARGLGFEMARAMAAFGAHVTLNGRDQAALDVATARIRAESGAAESLKFDVSDTAAAASAITGLVERHGRLDILVNNVGKRDRRGVWDVDMAGFNEMLITDLAAPFNLCREAARAMIARGEGGRIINVGSTAATMGMPSDPPYSAAKAGVAALTRVLASELGPHGINVNTIVPGAFLTDINKPGLSAPVNPIVRRAMGVLGRFGSPHEIGATAVFLASDAGSFITGSEIVVDGGMCIAV